MNPVILAIVLTVCGGPDCPVDNGKLESGFTPLFNGSDLSGWVIENKGKFSVRNGVIFLDRGAGWLRSEKTYQDFELRLDFRFVSKGADSGIFLRAVNTGSNWPAKNYQVQTMDNESIGAVYATGLAKVTMKRNADLVRKVRKSAGEWQTYAISVQGDRAEIKLNGELIIVAHGLTVQPGYIGIQGEGGQLEFRNIRIKQLK